MDLIDTIINFFTTPGIMTKTLSSLVAFILGIISTVLTTLWIERRKKRQITYSKTTERPLTVAREELKDKIRITYQESEVKDLYFFNLKLANTGRRTIKQQSFRCIFSEQARSIDPETFPLITTIPSGEVPIKKDETVIEKNQFRYTIGVLGIDQVINIDFLMVNNGRSSDFSVEFTANEINEVSCVEGEVSKVATLEDHVYKLIIGISVFIIAPPLFSAIPNIGRWIGTVFSLPFIVIAYQSLRPIVVAITRKLTTPPIVKRMINTGRDYFESVMDDAHVTTGNNIYPNNDA